MKKLLFLALTGVLFAISSIQPAFAAQLAVENQTAMPALLTVTYHICRDDRGIHVAPHQVVQLKPGLCTVNMVYASVTTRPGLAIACLPKKRTGASKYVVTIDADLKTCHVN
jgi:hypothetical protein